MLQLQQLQYSQITTLSSIMGDHMGTPYGYHMGPNRVRIL